MSKSGGIFNQQVIGDLRSRLVEHNGAVQAHPELVVKLGPAKALYKRWYGGPDPHQHAMAMLEGHLANLRGALLEKATRPFDPGRHPRGRRGEFQSGGGGTPPGGGGGQRGFYRDVSTRRQHKDLVDQNAGYQAFQTQIIPETRFSVLGPPIAGAAGIGAGALAGATATMHGTPTDRLTTAGLRWVGSKIGGGAGHVAGAVVVRRPRQVARAAIGAVNRRFGARIPRPSPTAGEPLIDDLRSAGGRVGAAVGHGIGRASAVFTTGAAALTRDRAEHIAGGGFRGRLIGRGAGALVGTLLPGLLYAASLHRMQARLGPYEDTLFPRHVRKALENLLDAPEVLAKQDELLAEGLTEGLAKVNYAGIGRRLITMLRPAIAHVRSPAAQLGPTGPAAEAARAAFQHFNQPVTVPSMRGARAAIAGAHVAGLGAAGAGVGAIAGAAAGTFNEKHPRDPRGRFAHKGSGAFAGARIGSVVGAGLGLATGLIAARTGHAALLGQALARLRGQAEHEGVNLPAAMRQHAEKTAETAHAHAYREANSRIIPPFPPSGGREAEHIAGHLRARGIAAWMHREGAAMQGGARSWYQFQLDRAFDATARQHLGKLGTIPTIDGDRSTENLVDRVDAEKLTDGQKKIWGNLLERRQKALGEIDAVYDERATAAREIGDHRSDLATEKTALTRALRTVPERWDDLKEDAKLAEIRTFAKTHLGHDLQARTREAAIAEIDERVPVWQTEASHRLDAIDRDIADIQPTLDYARNHVHADLDQDELRAVRNPFATGKQPFFRNRPAGIDTLEGFNRIRAAKGEQAAAPFLRESQAAKSGAIDHLEALISAREAALQAALPKSGLAHRAFHRFAPVLAGRLQQGINDYVALTGARRGALTGTQRTISDWLHAHQDPAQAWRTTRTLSNMAVRQGKRIAAGGLRNWKTISAIVGPLTALGAIDLSQPGIRRKFKVNPSTWRTPRDLGIVTEWPDAVRKPNEALFGLSYRDRQGREKFLHGLHIHSKEGHFNQIPFGTDVEQIKNAVRGGGGPTNAPRAEAIRVDDPKAVNTSIDALRAQGRVKDAGPPGFEFKQREGGSHTGDAQEQVRKGFYAKHIAVGEKFVGHSTRHRVPYFNSLRDLFEAPETQVLDAGTRAGLLVGTEKQRGIFANSGKVFQSGDKDKITRELIRQVHEQGNTLVPLNPDEGPHDEYTQVRRALWVASEHFDLSAAERQRVVDALDQAFTKATSKTPPETAAAARPMRGGGQSADTHNFDTFFAGLVHQVPPNMRPAAYADDATFKDEMRAIYNQAGKMYRRDRPDATDADQHRNATHAVNEFINTQFTKHAPGGRLAKIEDAALRLGTARQPAAIPRGTLPTAAIARVPPIGGASTRRVAAAPRPSFGSDVRQAANPTHVLGQAGSYGLSQAAVDAVQGLTQHFIPGGGLVGGALRLGLEGIAGSAASISGQKAGRQLGMKFGGTPEPQQSPGEAAVRGVGAGLAQLGAASHVVPGVTRGVAQATTSAIGRWAGNAAGAAGAAGGEETGGELGAEAGGVLGSLAGPVGTALGATVGTVAGAGIGMLTDEGLGILYRHLSRYGANVPKMAATSLGHANGMPPGSAGTAYRGPPPASSPNPNPSQQSISAGAA